MIRLNAETYIEVFTAEPDFQMYLSGWEATVKYLLGIPYVIYKKPLMK